MGRRGLGKRIAEVLPALRSSITRRPRRDRRGVAGEHGENRANIVRAIVSATLLVMLTSGARAWFGEQGFRDLSRLSRQRGSMRLEIERREQRIVELEQYLEQLRTDGAAREKIARERLGFAARDEFTFLLPSSSGDRADRSSAVSPLP